MTGVEKRERERERARVRKKKESFLTGKEKVKQLLKEEPSA
jgi:hypothetical protein